MNIPLIIYHHIYKNGGSVIKNIYKDNNNFIFKEKYLDIFFVDENYEYFANFNKFILFGHKIKYKKNLFDLYDLQYVVTIRNPKDRIISAYNYYILQFYNHYGFLPIIDLKTWIINMNRLSPVACFYQFQYFLGYSFFNPIDHTNVLNNLEDENMQNLYTQAIEKIKKFKIKFFLLNDANYLQNVENFFTSKKFQLLKNNIQSSNVTKERFKETKIIDKMFELNQLDKDTEKFLDKILYYDLKFYNYILMEGFHV